MRHAIQRSPQRLALRCAAVLGALLLVGSLGVSGAGAGSPTPPDDRATPQPTRESPAVVPGPSVTGGATGAPGTDAPSPTASSSPSGTAAPTPDPSDPSTPPTAPTPSPTESSKPTPKPTPAPSTSTEPTRQPTRPSTPPKPSRQESPTTRPSGGGPSSSSGSDGSQGWTSAAGGRQYSNNGSRAVEQGGQLDARTGFHVDPATGFPIHPRTGLLIDPSNGRMLSRGSLEPSDFAYDFSSGQIRLAASVQGEGDSAPEHTASSSAASSSGKDSSTAPVGYTGDGPQTRQEQRSTTASIGMSPSMMTVVLGALIVIGGLWYFFVFVRSPRPKPQHRD